MHTNCRQGIIGVRLGLALAAWICLVAGAMAVLNHYGAVPGPSGSTPEVWPADSSLSLPARRERLLIFLHPQCPCSRATLRQLERALAHARRTTDVRAVVFSPSDRDTAWSRTGLVDAASRIRGLQVVMDRDGIESRRFGALTSGHVLLYDAQGQLAFSGGLTPARGHEGDCNGLQALIAQLRGEATAPDRAIVYGCPISPHGPTCDEKEGTACLCTR